MPNETNARILEVWSGSGQLLFSLRLVQKPEEAIQPEAPKQEPPKEKGDGGKREEKKQAPAGSSEPLMTDAQKRYLFRILAEQGFEGDSAYEELKRSLRVDTLKKVSKLEASREIERRLEALKEGAA